MKHEDQTQQIIGAAMVVLNELKPGLDEKLYENALVMELEDQGYTVQHNSRNSTSNTEGKKSANWFLT